MTQYSPAASVIDSSTGGTLLTNGMPGTCGHMGSQISPCNHMTHPPCNPVHSGRQCPTATAHVGTPKHKLRCAWDPFCSSGGNNLHVRHPPHLCQAAAKRCASQEYLHRTAAASCLMLTFMIHAWSGFGTPAHHAVKGQKERAGNMKPPRKPAKTVMEIANSLAKATATRILHIHR